LLAPLIPGFEHNWRTFLKKMQKDRKIMSSRQNGKIIIEVGGNMCLTVQNISVI